MSHSQRELEEQLLVRLAQQGDNEAFTELIDCYDRRLLYYVRRLLAETDAAYDVMQTIWLIVHRRLSRLRSPEAFRVWIYRIAHDQAVSELRRKCVQAIADEAGVPPRTLQDFLATHRWDTSRRWIDSSSWWRSSTMMSSRSD
jgi:DNA-directed RNA polymerase specialized sigma24 family protein